MKRFLAAALIGVTLATAPACGMFEAAKDAQALQAETVYTGLLSALEDCDRAEAAYLEGLAAPTAEDLFRAQDHMAKLKDARELLLAAKSAYESEDYTIAVSKLAMALMDLDVVATELHALGVHLAKSTDAALAATHKALGV